MLKSIVPNLIFATVISLFIVHYIMERKLKQYNPNRVSKNIFTSFGFFQVSKEYKERFPEDNILFIKNIIYIILLFLIILGMLSVH